MAARRDIAYRRTPRDRDSAVFGHSDVETAAGQNIEAKSPAGSNVERSDAFGAAIRKDDRPDPGELAYRAEPLVHECSIPNDRAPWFRHGVTF